MILTGIGGASAVGLAFLVFSDLIRGTESGAWILGATIILIFIGAFVVLWWILRKNFFQPLVAVIRESEMSAHGGAEIDQWKIEVSKLAFLLDGKIGQLESDMKKVRDSARTLISSSDGDRERLESILRDLSEGVVVCNLAHQVLMFNRMALWLFSEEGEIGIGRSLFGFLEADEIKRVLENLLQDVEIDRKQSGREETISLTCRLLEDDRNLSARMTLTFNGAKIPDGYVLTISSEQLPSVSENPAADRDYYDFDLFHRPLSSGFSVETPLRNLSYVVFDTETTGLNPLDGDKLISIAGVRIVNSRILRNETFESLVNPERLIPARATRVHGITDAHVASAPKGDEVLSRFRGFVGDSVLVAHNAGFDMAVLEVSETGSRLFSSMMIFDTHLLSASLHDHASGHGLDSIASRLGVTIEAGERHTALGDALITAEIFVKFLSILEARGLNSLGQVLDRMKKQAKISLPSSFWAQ
jgi:DNA polymerase-3 subunit epsilon